MQDQKLLDIVAEAIGYHRIMKTRLTIDPRHAEVVEKERKQHEARIAELNEVKKEVFLGRN